MESRRLSLSYRGLLSIYIILPLCLAAVLMDAGLFHGYLRMALPRNPEQLRILTIFIALPHIVASALSFIDKEYVEFYRPRLYRAAALVLVAGFIIPYFSPLAAFALYAAYTVYHVMAQQTGITTLMTGKPNREFMIWKWLLIITSWVIYFLIFDGYGQYHMRVPPSPPLFHQMMINVMYMLLLPGAFFTWRVARKSATSIGKQYTYANYAMVLLAAIFLQEGYFFFAIFAPRIVHDLSGFYFYVVHDHNRNLGRPRNAFYRILGFTRMPMVFLSPLMSILLANILQELHLGSFFANLLLGLSFFHYYTEGFMWKRDSIHRLAVGKVNPAAPVLVPGTAVATAA